MQRSLTFLLLLYAFLIGGCAQQSTRVYAPVETRTPAHAAPNIYEKQPAQSETTPILMPTAPAPTSIQAGAKIALLLPLKSQSFGRAADVVRQGFMIAANVDNPGNGLTTKVYSTGERLEEIMAAYQQAVQDGANVVVGPLTRNAVSAFAASNQISVPTLALNVPESAESVPHNLYFFGLSIESEARQIARMAYNDGRRSALLVSSASPLTKRAQQAFTDEWRRRGGEIAGQITLPKAQENYPSLRDASTKPNADMIFLAVEADKARLVRPYLDNTLATYATSQIYGNKQDAYKNVDLQDVRFIDMPWLLQPDHPAVMVYPHAEAPANIELGRLYALGIDAFRLGVALLNPTLRDGFILDGVTGKISLRDGYLMERELTPAQFQQTDIVILESAKQ